MELTRELANRIKDAVKSSELPVTIEQGIAFLLADHDIWEKHSLTQLVTENAALRTRLEEVEQKLKIYIEWDNNGDECFMPEHADLKQRLARVEQELDDYKKSYEDLRDHYTPNSLRGQLATAQARIGELSEAQE